MAMVVMLAAMDTRLSFCIGTVAALGRLPQLALPLRWFAATEGGLTLVLREV